MRIPDRPQRVLVGGASGSGKTRLAGRIGALLGLPHTELDGLHWHAGWTPNPAFLAEVTALAATGRWVSEWQYPSARPVLAARADLLVWLDPPRWRVLGRVVRRTLRRRLGRVPLWHGNVEPPLRTILTDPAHIVRWSMTSHRALPGMVREALGAHPELPMVRVRTGRDVRRLLALLAERAE